MPAFKVRANMLCLSVLAVAIESRAQASDLLDVYLQVEQNNIQLKSALIDYRITASQREEIASEYGSTLSLNLKPGYRFSNKQNETGASIDYQLSLTKPIYQGQLGARLSQADTTIKRQQVALDYENQKLISEVAKTYLNVAAAQDQLALSYAEKTIIRQDLYQLKRLYAVQLATVTDISETQLRLSQASFAIATAKLTLETARKALDVLSGLRSTALALLNDHSSLFPLQPRRLVDWVKLANARNPELLLARFDLKIQQQNIQIEKTADGASIDLFVSYEGEAALASGSLPDERAGQVGFDINVPLYTGRNVSKVRSALLQRQKSLYSLTTQQREVAQNVQLAYLTVKSGVSSVKNLQATVVKSEEALESIRRGQIAGTRTMTDVLSFSRESIGVKRNYSEARYKLLIDWVNLKLLAGVLSVNDLIKINQLLVPQSVGSSQALTVEDSFDEAEHNGRLEDAWE